MHIKLLNVKNFKGFESHQFSFHPNFNLVVGENGHGKTSTLDAVAVAMGSWFLGLRGYDSRNIRGEDVRTITTFENDRYEIRQQYPVEIQSSGYIEEGENISWTRTVTGEGGRTTRLGAKSIQKVAETYANKVMSGERVILPAFSYYGAGRLWQEPKDMSDKKKGGNESKTSLAPQDFSDDNIVDDAEYFAFRFVGYRYSVDPRCSPRDLLRWMRFQRKIEIDEKIKSVPFRQVLLAIKKCLPVQGLRYSIRHGTLIAEDENRRLTPFSSLSDGYRNMIAMVGDLAYKCAVLNPHLEGDALNETPGIVLIDELDLHLHPKWQRRVIEDLRTTFPKIQFICTTHSPFLIQSLRSGEELTMLDGQPTADVSNMSVEEIARGIMGIPNPQVSLRYEEMKMVARQYFELLELAEKTPKEKLSEFKEQLSEKIAPYADNPAFQAFLEMKRAAKLGE